MARQLRIEYPGAFYHITSRGNQKQPIALSDRDRFTFLRIIRDACEKFGAIIHTYCIMGNHYHLLLQTLSANLSRIMHFINTTYTHYFNWKNGKSGHLFQGRYSAILIDSEAYGLEVSRYSHLNPVRAKIVAQTEDYPWSSYREFMGSRTAPPWLDVKSHSRPSRWGFGRLKTEIRRVRGRGDREIARKPHEKSGTIPDSGKR